MPDAEQRQHGDDAALATVVRPQDQYRVFQRDDQDQRPKDQRYAPDRCGLRRSTTGDGRLHGLLERVERAGSDIAVDDTDRT